MITRNVKVGELVLDFNLYPRHQVDSTNVKLLATALEAGAEFPRIIVEGKSLRVVDGFHRDKAYFRAFGPDHEIEVECRTYGSDAEMFLDCVELNAAHGKQLSPFDRARILIRADEFRITVDQLAGALHLTVDRAKDLMVRKTAMGNGSKPVVLKNTLKHLAGSRLSKKQKEGNDRAGGMNQLFYLNQVINLINNDLLDMDNENICKALGVLGGLLSKAKAA